MNIKTWFYVPVKKILNSRGKERFDKTHVSIVMVIEESVPTGTEACLGVY